MFTSLVGSGKGDLMPMAKIYFQNYRCRNDIHYDNKCCNIFIAYRLEKCHDM